MNALVYLLRKGFKNSLLALLKKPGKLTMYLLLLLLMIFLWGSSQSNGSQSPPFFWFTGGLFLFVTFFVFLSVVTGLSNGGAIFEMSDVNFLFPSPISPRKILVYGIVRMVKTAFFANLFLLFQKSALTKLGIDSGGMAVIFTGFLFSTVVTTTASLLIYSMTNGRPGRKRLVKGLMVLLFLPLLVFAAFCYLTTGDMMGTVQTVVQSPFLQFIPVAGWTAGGVTAFLLGNVSEGLLFSGLNLLLLAGMIAVIMLTNPEYYEDVLVATETAYEKKRAVSEGNIYGAAHPHRARKVAKTGISGVGAAALFGKHRRENSRQNSFGFLPFSSVLVVIGAIVFSMIVKDIWNTLLALCWAQIFLIGTGRGLQETYVHYIYLIPESSFKKILWSNMEIVARALVENLLIFGIAGALLHAPLLSILLGIVVYTLFSFLLLGINYLSMRFTGADMSNGMLIMLYFLSVIVVMLPGAAGAFWIGGALGGDAGRTAGLAVLSVWELAAGLGCFALAKGVLHNCDMSMLKTGR